MESGQSRYLQLRYLLISIILLQLGGFVFLWMKIPAPDQIVRHEPPPAIDPTSTRAAVKLADEQVLRSAIQSVLRQELTAVRQQDQEEKQRLIAAASVGPVNPRSIYREAPHAVFQQSNAIVDRALASGVWTDTDNNELLKLSGQLSEPQRVQLLEKIFGAINTQRMKAAGALPSL
jgi:hypothetical protein